MWGCALLVQLWEVMLQVEWGECLLLCTRSPSLVAVRRGSATGVHVGRFGVSDTLLPPPSHERCTPKCADLLMGGHACRPHARRQQLHSSISHNTSHNTELDHDFTCSTAAAQLPQQLSPKSLHVSTVNSLRVSRVIVDTCIARASTSIACTLSTPVCSECGSSTAGGGCHCDRGAGRGSEAGCGTGARTDAGRGGVIARVRPRRAWAW